MLWQHRSRLCSHPARDRLSRKSHFRSFQANGRWDVVGGSLGCSCGALLTVDIQLAELEFGILTLAEIRSHPCSILGFARLVRRELDLEFQRVIGDRNGDRLEFAKEDPGKVISLLRRSLTVVANTHSMLKRISQHQTFLLIKCNVKVFGGYTVFSFP